MSRLPVKTKEDAIKLRCRGYSLKEIADNLHIAKSTSSLWTRNIKLGKGAQQRLKRKRLFGYYRASLTWRRKREEVTHKYYLSALELMDKINVDCNHSKLYCALLYWCEGGKSINKSAGVRFVNSDPVMIRTFLLLFRKSFKVEEKKFRVLMHLHSYHNEKKQKMFWSKLTDIPENHFNKTFFKANTEKRIRADYPGCIMLSYNDSKVLCEIQAIYRTFSEKMGASVN